MKRFDFPLEKVREWRREQAELEERKLQKLYGDLEGIAAERARIEAELEEAVIAVRAQAQPLPADLANLDQYREYARQCLLRNRQRGAECEKQIALQRQALVEARRRFELLDRLRQKAWAEWNAAREKEQEELAAELYLAKRQRENRFSEN